MYVFLRVCGKLAGAELTDNKWPDEESFLVAARRVCHDRVAAANLEEEEEEKPILGGHRWLAINTISRLKLAGKFGKEIHTSTWLEPKKKTLSRAISQG